MWSSSATGSALASGFWLPLRTAEFTALPKKSSQIPSDTIHFMFIPFRMGLHSSIRKPMISCPTSDVQYMDNVQDHELSCFAEAATRIAYDALQQRRLPAIFGRPRGPTRPLHAPRFPRLRGPQTPGSTGLSRRHKPRRIEPRAPYAWLWQPA